jgi:DNA-binding MarR family transcriptional regulator
MTVLVTGLERHGLVTRHSDPTDRRVTLVAITAEGLHYLRSRRHAGTDALAQLIRKLPPGEASALAAAIPALQHLRGLDDELRDPDSGATGTQHAPG